MTSSFTSSHQNMEPQMNQPAPTTSIALKAMLHPNHPSFMSSFGSDDNESNEQFDFNISRELLLDPNDVLRGEKIEERPNSIVYKGLFKTNVPVALKIVQPSSRSTVSIEDKEQFQKEVLLLSSMKHDNIVKFVGACIEPQLMIVTELLEGDTLQRSMFNSRHSPLDLKMALSFALDISRAMEYLHSNGIIHRDLNPRNVWVTGDMKQVKLADFGLATEKTIGDMTCDVGTYRWMAPEVCSRAQKGEKTHYDQKVDVYSFALLFWALLTNEKPFSGMGRTNIPYFVSMGKRPSLMTIPDEVVPILDSCWAKDPEARLEFKEITIILENLLNNFCSWNSTDTTTSEDEACDSELEGLKKPKQEKKRVMNMILNFFKKCFSSKCCT